MEAKLDSLGKAIYKNIKKEILNENKIKSKILKTAKLNSFVWWNEKWKNKNYFFWYLLIHINSLNTSTILSHNISL